MPSKKLWSSARGEGGGSWQRGLPLALLAGEVLWSLVVCKLCTAWGVCYLHPRPRAGRGSAAHPGPSEWLGSQRRPFPLQAQAWDVVPLGIMPSVGSLCQARDKRKVKKWGTSLLLALQTQGTWCRQGGEAL